MIYNPFMPTRHLHPRTSGLIAYGGGEGKGKSAEHTPITSFKPSDKVLAEAKADAKAKAKAKEAKDKRIAKRQAERDAARAAAAKRELEEKRALKLQKAGETTAERQARLDAEAAAAQAEETSQGAADMMTAATTDPTSLVTTADVSTIDTNAAGTNIAEGTGSLDMEDIPQVETTEALDPHTYDVVTSADAVDDVTSDMEAVQGTVSTDATVIAEEGSLSEGAIADAAQFDEDYIQEVEAGTLDVQDDELVTAQGLDEEAIKTEVAQTGKPETIVAAQATVDPNEIPEAAQIAESDMAQAEIMTAAGLSADATAVAAKLAKFSVSNETLVAFTEGKIEAQDTVQGQLSELMKSFDDGTPAWAAGAMRAANAAMASRGLGSSSLAAAAIVQATMESAIPIASADANAFREMKLNNLGRQQQVALSNAAAQQGVELANFNAEQQTALQNSQNAFQLQSQNLSNAQSAMIANAQIKASLQGQNLSNRQQANLAEAARYAEVSNLNLNNRQQAILQDSQNALDVDLANLNARQQSYIVNAQLASTLQGKKMDNMQSAAMANAARFADVANLNFTAKEQAAMHNSTLLQSIGAANLTAKNAAILQNAANQASMDVANLNNRQQAAVVNAQSFLAMDMKNMDLEQQNEAFKNQAKIDAIFSDQSAENAARQFNAASQTQTDQFFANMAQQASVANAGLTLDAQKFIADNALVVAQANALWRQNATTLDTAAQNAANRDAAVATNNMTQSTMDQIWQRERDIMDQAFRQSESAADRAMSILLSDKSDAFQKAFNDKNSKDAEKSAKWRFWANAIGLDFD